VELVVCYITSGILTDADITIVIETSSIFCNFEALVIIPLMNHVLGNKIHVEIKSLVYNLL